MLDSLRKELLNLTLSNNLLKLREFKAKGLTITGTSSEEILQKLILESKNCIFFSENLNGSAPRNVFTIKTNYSDKELDKRLLNTYKEAKEFIEERGVNALYISLGVLKWYEDDNSNIEILSPLLLIPIQIEKIIYKGETSFELKQTGETVEPNYTLERKMEVDFGIKLPIFDEEQSISDYFYNIQNSLKNKNRWEIVPNDIRVNLFSFLKLMMYHDLDENRWDENNKPTDNFLIKNLLDNFGNLLLATESNSAQEEFSLDNLAVSEINHILDADSSQAEAIDKVFKNKYLVIKGPPGTGKSQTITNIIASCIQKGKTVLFVSEKLAALEVVKNRLEKTGLGSACLELHSYKANRREILESVRQTLEQKTQQNVRDNGELARLNESRLQLNNYFSSLVEPIRESEITPFQAIGEILIAKQRFPDISFLPTANIKWTYSDIKKREESIKSACDFIKQNGKLTNSLFWGNGRVQIGILEEQELKNQVSEIVALLRQINENSIRLSEKLRIESPSNLRGVSQILTTTQLLLENPGTDGINTGFNANLITKDEIIELFQIGNEFHHLKTTYADKFIADAHKQNFHTVKLAYETKGEKWYRFIHSDFRLSQKQLLSVLKIKPPSISEQAELATILVYKAELVEKAKILNSVAKDIFIDGSNWDFENDVKWLNRRKGAEYIFEIQNKWNKGLINHKILDKLDIPTGSFSRDVKDLHKLIFDFQSKTDDWISRLEFEFQYKSKLFGHDVPIFQIEQQLLTIYNKFELLNISCQWNAHKKRLEQLECDKVTHELLQSEPLNADKVLDSWKYSMMMTLLNDAFTNRRALDTTQLSTKATTFKETDKYLIEKHNRQKIKYEHLGRIPSINTVGEQMSILRNEINKQRRHLPLRKLLDQAGEMIVQIKPVFMMSPLSVAHFLKPDRIKFDYVIFDEASQVKPIEAFGALLRGSNAVVVGDDKQLPPSDFFNQVVDLEEIDDESEYSNVSDMESILDLFVTKNAKQTMLQWHYRSKHESLIAVSNKYFYDDKLINLPSAFPQNEDLGLQFKHLPDTIYATQKNEKEAEYIINSLRNHAQLFPSPDSCSIGIVAFSIRQKDCIENLLMRVRKEDSDFDKYMSSAEKAKEPFFIKNLENVQGDERDVIFVSICYGRTIEGKLNKNFGPVNRVGGERRLNVLFTRARLKCVLFSNFTASDLQISDTDANGLKIFKAFLDYAQNRNFNVNIFTNKPTDSPFEDCVKAALERAGYEVHTQIGSVGYFIDLAVPHPEQKGRYLLGIECDGATYHSSRSARERDRLRQGVLEGLGWEIYRIWSTDWFRNPSIELKKLVDHIVVLKSGFTKPISDKAEESEPILEQLPDNSNQWKDKYQQPKIDLVEINQELHQVEDYKLIKIVSEFLKVESPAHEDYIKTIITQQLGINRIGTRIEAKFYKVFSLGEKNGEWIKREGFIWRTNQKIEKARDRSYLPEKYRQIEWISPEEIQFTLKNIVEEGRSIDRVELMKETLKILTGGARLTQGIEYVIAKEVDNLILAQTFILNENIIRLKK